MVRNEEHHQFVISASKYIQNRKFKTYIFLRKRNAMVHELINESMHSEKKTLARRNSLFQDATDIGVLTPELDENGVPVIRRIKFSDLSDYMRNEERSQVRLNFEHYSDPTQCVHFALVVYQDKRNLNANSMLCYDTDSESFVKRVSVNPSRIATSYLYRDEEGFNCFKIVRTSDKMLYRDAQDAESFATCYDYSVFMMFSAKLGRIQVLDYHMRYNWTGKTFYEDTDKYQFHLVGMKQLFMSEQCVIDTEWEYLRHSNVVPFLDGDDSYHGCTLVISHGPNFRSEINMVDSPTKNNLMNYQSDVLVTGSKRFMLKLTDADNYLLVVSARLRQDQIDSFDDAESHAMLRKGLV